MLGALMAEATGGVATPESHFKHELPLDRWSARRALRRIEGHWRFRIWELGPGSPPDDLGNGDEVLGWLVRRYAESQGRPRPTLWVDHTPENVLHWSPLFRRFPEAKGIHLVRDGRGVAASLQGLTWGPRTTLARARYWRDRVRAGLAAEAIHPDRLCRVRYEDLLADPATTVARLARFLEAEDPAPTGPSGAPTGGTFATPRYTRNQHRLVGQPPDPSRAQAWTRALPPREVELIEAVAGDLLDELGYPRRHPTPRPPSAGEVAGSRMVEALQQALVLPLRRIPTRGRYVLDAARRRLPLP